MPSINSYVPRTSRTKHTSTQNKHTPKASQKLGQKRFLVYHLPYIHNLIKYIRVTRGRRFAWSTPRPRDAAVPGLRAIQL